MLSAGLRVVCTRRLVVVRSRIVCAAASPPHDATTWAHSMRAPGSWRWPDRSGLTYLKTYTLQVVQGRLFGMGQSKANQWIHVLLPALLAALRDLGDAPTRSLTALAH